MAKYISVKLLCLGVTLLGIVYQSYADNLICIVCVPKGSETEATVLRREINTNFGTAVRECDDNSIEFKARLLLDKEYSRNCSSNQWCYKHATGNWSARTCRANTGTSGGCTSVNNKFDCYCNNKNKCNSATGLESTVINMIYAVVSALTLNKFM